MAMARIKIHHVEVQSISKILFPCLFCILFSLMLAFDTNIYFLMGAFSVVLVTPPQLYSIF